VIAGENRDELQREHLRMLVVIRHANLCWSSVASHELSDAPNRPDLQALRASRHFYRRRNFNYGRNIYNARDECSFRDS
jgi:hypothetical protein